MTERAKRAARAISDFCHELYSRGHQPESEAVIAAEYADLEAENERLRELLAALAGNEPCRLDHNGNCQEHLWFGGKCVVAEARELLAKDTVP